MGHKGGTGAILAIQRANGQSRMGRTEMPVNALIEWVEDEISSYQSFENQKNKTHASNENI